MQPVANIAVWNAASTPIEFDLTNFVKAAQIYVDEVMVPVWGRPAVLTLSDGPIAGQWGMVFMDNADEPGALAYHTVSDGLPLAKVFVKTILDNKETISGGASHELAEMLVDPLCSLMVAHPGGGYYAYETCLAGNTRIPLGNGSTKTIGELATQKSFGARLTKRNAQTVSVIFDDGSHVQCTPDHRFLTMSGAYIQAQHLHSGHMLPRFTPADAINGAGPYSVNIGDNLRRSRILSNLRNIFFGQFRSPTQLSPHSAVTSHSPFLTGVNRIFMGCSDEQMRGSDTQRRITLVADKLAAWNFTLGHFIRESMREYSFSLDSQLPIFGTALRAGPQPASFSLFNLVPKSLFDNRCVSVVSRKSRVDIAMPLHSRPMHTAQVFGKLHTPASTNGASPQISGLSLRHHKTVVRIEKSSDVDVFDLTVPKYHNFAVDAGVLVHNCDPVEEATFDIDGFPMSDVVFPRYFEPLVNDGIQHQYSWMKTVSAPFQVATGGYQSVYLNGQWTEIFGSREKMQRFAQEDRRGHRSEYRRATFPATA